MSFGKLLLIIGLMLTTAGLVAVYIPGAVAWFGRLPGDIHITRGTFQVYVPVASMILISALLTLLANLIFRK